VTRTGGEPELATWEGGVGLVDSAREKNKALAVAEIYRISLKRGRYRWFHPFDTTKTKIEKKSPRMGLLILHSPSLSAISRHEYRSAALGAFLVAVVLV